MDLLPSGFLKLVKRRLRKSATRNPQVQQDAPCLAPLDGRGGSLRPRPRQHRRHGDSGDGGRGGHGGGVRQQYVSSTYCCALFAPVLCSSPNSRYCTIRTLALSDARLLTRPPAFLPVNIFFATQCFTPETTRRTSSRRTSLASSMSSPAWVAPRTRSLGRRG